MPRVTSKGQVTIPKKIREKLGIEKGDEVTFSATDDGVMIEKQVEENPFEKYRGVSETEESPEEWVDKYRVDKYRLEE
ncbi:MAG: AbrB/MazE/SpoVT family DNA-binding domain-containing protein [Halobacteria archaeon]